MGDTTKLLPLLTWRAALCDSELGSTSRLVALTLSLYMNERGTSAFPGAARLSHDAALSERRVREHLSILVDAGWLQLVERGGLRGEQRRANAYRSAVPLTHRHGSDGTPDGESPLPLTESALTPDAPSPHLFKNSPLNSGARAHAIPDEFLVSDEMVEWVERECPMVRWQWQTEKFVDWAKSASGRNTVKKDWVRAWRNWMRSEQEKART